MPTPAVAGAAPDWAPPAPTPDAAAARPSPAGASAATLLFDSREAAEQAVDRSADRIAKSGHASKLSEIARKVARREIRRAIVELLDVKLSAVVLRGWQRHGALLTAAERTTKGGGREVVLLADHTVTSTHSPHIEVAIDGVEIGRVTSQITMSLQLIGVNAVVERGHLVGIEGGSIAAAAKFSVEDVPIASRTRTIDAVAMIQLDRPVRLAPALVRDAQRPRP